MKKQKLIISFIFLILIGVTFYQLLSSYLEIKNLLIHAEVYSQSEKVQQNIKKYEVIECEFNLLEPKYAFVTLDNYYSNDLEFKFNLISFYQLSRSNIFSSKWQEELIGVSNVKNLKFEEIVSRVKSDCEPFKKTKYESANSSESWSYTPKRNKSEYSEEQLRKDEIWHKVQTYKTSLNSLTEEQKQKIKDHFGDWTLLDDEDFVKWGDEAKRQVEAGEFLLEN